MPSTGNAAVARSRSEEDLLINYVQQVNEIFDFFVCPILIPSKVGVIRFG